MLGFRGASRYSHPAYSEGFALECAALRRVREEMGLSNLRIMVPFCRTVEEGRRVIATMAANGLKSGENGLEIYIARFEAYGARGCLPRCAAARRGRPSSGPRSIARDDGGGRLRGPAKLRRTLAPGPSRQAAGCGAPPRRDGRRSHRGRGQPDRRARCPARQLDLGRVGATHLDVSTPMLWSGDGRPLLDLELLSRAIPGPPQRFAACWCRGSSRPIVTCERSTSISAGTSSRRGSTAGSRPSSST